MPRVTGPGAVAVGGNAGREARLRCAAAMLAALTLLGAANQTRPSAPAAGQPRLNAYFASHFTDLAYQKAALDKVAKAWKPPAPLPAPGRKTVVIAGLGRDGKIIDTRLHMKSGDDAFDAAALAALRGAAPFAPLPKSFTEAGVEVHWHFEVAK